MALAKPSYTHTQTTASTTWTIVHGLNILQPVVNVWLPINGVQTAVLPKLIQVTDSNTTVITFSSAKSGTAVIQ